MFEGVITHYQTLQTWIANNATRYYNFNVLPHALPHALQYIVSQFSMVWGYLQRVTPRYGQIYKKMHINIHLKKNLSVTSKNPLQIAQNQTNFR